MELIGLSANLKGVICTVLCICIITTCTKPCLIDEIASVEFNLNKGQGHRIVKKFRGDKFMWWEGIICST